MITLLARPVDEVDSVQRYPLMETCEIAGNQYVYMKGATNIAAGSFVTYDEVGVPTLLAADAVGPVAIAMGAVSAATKFGWFLVSGLHSAGLTANDVADNGNLYATATGGKVDDAVVAGDRIHGAWARSAGTGASNIKVQISFPYVTNLADA